jgi:hypothetical protein
MPLVLAKSPPARFARAILRRTRGRTHGPVTRLMSPSDFGEILKPYVFLDLFDHEGPPFNGPLHLSSRPADCTAGTFSSCASGNTRRVPCIHATNVHGSSDCVRDRSSLRDTLLRALHCRHARARE